MEAWCTLWKSILINVSVLVGSICSDFEGKERDWYGDKCWKKTKDLILRRHSAQDGIQNLFV